MLHCPQSQFFRVALFMSEYDNPFRRIQEEFMSISSRVGVCWDGWKKCGLIWERYYRNVLLWIASTWYCLFSFSFLYCFFFSLLISPGSALSVDYAVQHPTKSWRPSQKCPSHHYRQAWPDFFFIFQHCRPFSTLFHPLSSFMSKCVCTSSKNGLFSDYSSAPMSWLMRFVGVLLFGISVPSIAG